MTIRKESQVSENLATTQGHNLFCAECDGKTFDLFYIKDTRILNNKLISDKKA